MPMPCLLRQCSPAGLRDKVTGGIRGYRAMDIPLIAPFLTKWTPHQPKQNAPEKVGTFAKGRFEVDDRTSGYSFLSLSSPSACSTACCDSASSMAFLASAVRFAR